MSYANNTTVFTTFPFPRADLYNIQILEENLLGTDTTATFGNNRFIITKNVNGFNIWSNDTDVKAWFKLGNIYSFKCKITKK